MTLRTWLKIGFSVWLAFLGAGGLGAQHLLTERARAHTLVAEYRQQSERQQDTIQELRETIRQLKASQVHYVAPASYGIEHYASPITFEQGLAFIAEARWSHQELLNKSASGQRVEYTTEAWERKWVERYDQLRELLLAARKGD